MSLPDAKKYAGTIDGWLSDAEGELLFNLSKKCSRSIVEIGSYKGKSTVYIGHGSSSGRKVDVYAVDPHTGSAEHQKNGEIWTFDEFKKNISEAGVSDLVVPLVKTSAEAAKEINTPLDFVFIDGAHDYESVKQDYTLWYPKLVVGGVLAFHDTIDWPGPKKVASEYLYKSNIFRDVRFVDSITYGEKIERNSLGDRIRNRFFLLVKNVRDFAWKLNLPKPIRESGKKFINYLKI